MKLVLGWGDVSDGGVKAHGVVVVDICGEEAAGLLDVEGGVPGRMQSALSDLCQIAFQALKLALLMLDISGWGNSSRRSRESHGCQIQLH
jgi:hypothetical protein